MRGGDGRKEGGGDGMEGGRITHVPRKGERRCRGEEQKEERPSSSSSSSSPPSSSSSEGEEMWTGLMAKRMMSGP